MLMAWGPFRFTVPTYSIETLRRSVEPRLDAAPIIGAAPSIHRLGPGNEKITLQSTFHPHHLNGRGLSQLNRVRAAVNSMAPYPLVSSNGSSMNIFGLWIATSLSDDHEMFDTVGTPGTVQTTLELMRYDGGSPARSIAVGFTFEVSFNLF